MQPPCWIPLLLVALVHAVPLKQSDNADPSPPMPSLLINGAVSNTAPRELPAIPIAMLAPPSLAALSSQSTTSTATTSTESQNPITANQARSSVPLPMQASAPPTLSQRQIQDIRRAILNASPRAPAPSPRFFSAELNPKQRTPGSMPLHTPRQAPNAPNLPSPPALPAKVPVPRAIETVSSTQPSSMLSPSKRLTAPDYNSAGPQNSTEDPAEKADTKSEHEDTDTEPKGPDGRSASYKDGDVKARGFAGTPEYVTLEPESTRRSIAHSIMRAIGLPSVGKDDSEKQEVRNKSGQGTQWTGRDFARLLVNRWARQVVVQ